MDIEDINIEHEVARVRYYTTVSMIIPDVYNLSTDNPMPIPTAPTDAISTPGFVFIAGIIGLLAAIYKHRKSRC